MTKRILWTLCFFATSLAAGDLAVPRKIIDSPTAGNLARGAYHLDFRVYPGGGLLSEIAVGVTNGFYLGLAYGGSNIIGTDMIEPNDHVGILAQLRVLEENLALPAVAIGYNNQALGPYHNDYLDITYFVQAKGVYLVLSKNYRLLGNLGLHAGINYRLEEQDDVPDLFFMANKELGREFSLSAEYDAAINNDQIEWGHLNLGAAWLFGKQIQLEIDFKNILEVKRLVDANRELRIVYIDAF